MQDEASRLLGVAVEEAMVAAARGAGAGSGEGEGEGEGEGRGAALLFVRHVMQHRNALDRGQVALLYSLYIQVCATAPPPPAPEVSTDLIRNSRSRHDRLNTRPSLPRKAVPRG